MPESDELSSSLGQSDNPGIDVASTDCETLEHRNLRLASHLANNVHMQKNTAPYDRVSKALPANSIKNGLANLCCSLRSTSGVKHMPISLIVSMPNKKGFLQVAKTFECELKHGENSTPSRTQSRVGFKSINLRGPAALKEVSRISKISACLPLSSSNPGCNSHCSLVRYVCLHHASCF